MRPVRGILESSLYVDDLEAARRFYTEVLGLHFVTAEPGRHVFLRCGKGMLLLFNPQSTIESHNQGIDVPEHGAQGPGHLAFAATEDELEDWRQRLESHKVRIEKEIKWPNGARSIYFRDPHGNSLEFATPSLWDLPSA